MREAPDFTSGSAPGVPSPLSAELRQSLAAATEQLLQQLLGRPISPRLKLLTIDDVCKATTLGKSTIYKMVEQKTFPRPMTGVGKNLWRESTLIHWARSIDPNKET